MFQRVRTGMWRTASAPRAWVHCGDPCHQLCCLLLGEIVAAQCPFSGCIGKPLLLPAATPAGGIGNYMDTRWIRARTTNRDEAQTVISDQHSGHRYLCRSVEGTTGLFLKGAPF